MRRGEHVNASIRGVALFHAESRVFGVSGAGWDIKYPMFHLEKFKVDGRIELKEFGSESPFVVLGIFGPSWTEPPTPRSRLPIKVVYQYGKG
jgi:hypothetical protein